MSFAYVWIQPESSKFFCWSAECILGIMTNDIFLPKKIFMTVLCPDSIHVWYFISALICLCVQCQTLGSQLKVRLRKHETFSKSLMIQRRHLSPCRRPRKFIIRPCALGRPQQALAYWDCRVQDFLQVKQENMKLFHWDERVGRGNTA